MPKKRLIWVWLAICWLALSACQPYEFKGTLLDSPQPVSDAAFQSDEGGEVRLSDFSDRLLLLYFGYTYCPDICPTTLYEIRDAMRALGDDAAKVQVAMVTVDPERDTPEQMDAYLNVFDPSFMGLREPDSSKLDPLLAEFGVDRQIEEPESESAAGYLVSHTSAVLLVDNMNLILVWTSGMPGEDMASDLRELLRQR